MALTPQSGDAFFREVDEELRREQIGSFWRRYGRFVAIAVLLGLAAFGGWLYWQHRQKVAADAASEQMTQALMKIGDGQFAAATPSLDKLKAEGNPGYRGAAALTEAGIAMERGDTAGAVAAYKAVTADKNAPQAFRDLALVRMTAAQFDTLPPAQIIEQLKPLAIAGSPWFGSAGEMTAIAYVKMGKPELAGPLFAAIAKEEGAPASIRERAGRLAMTLGVDAAVAKPGPAKE
ncbi:hypothetical protein ACFB49_35520 [Sphingomonas sp. DBB INV C78]|uniref:tetratricopeptide repeat protein n=1 Tax=Sphingomonas sp. DBB INV C78 TaxID=3349434 RepID=UPI0036D2386C